MKAVSDRLPTRLTPGSGLNALSFGGRRARWSWLGQVFCDGKQASCQAAVARVVSFCLQTGKDAPTDDTGDYFKALANLSEHALLELSCDVAHEMEAAAEPTWLWKSLHPKLIDGFTFTMPDTPKNQKEYPQQDAQAPGVGQPIARVVAILSLSTACILDASLGPYKRKQTGETSLLRRLLNRSDYDVLPRTLTVRELRYQVIVPDRRTKSLTIITTLLDPKEYSLEDVAQLYGFRWDVELDIRSIKSSLNLEYVRCKSPEMVRREFWTTMLAYNLIRTTAASAALLHDQQPRQISFTATCQYVLSCWVGVATGSMRGADWDRYCKTFLAQPAQCEVANRPGRLEPRVIKKRPETYKLMQKPREVLRRELRKHCT